VEDVADLRASGKEILLVSSGAVALGRGVLNLSGKLKLEEKQAAAACGQPLLMEAWKKALAKHNINCAQLLLTLDDSEDRRRYLNARNTLEVLLSHGVIPIVNENDTVATAELRVGDNDRLSARVAQMSGAEMLVLLSDVDGLYTANPSQDPDAQHIGIITEITPEIRAMAGDSTSRVGTGGMVTKLEAAEIANAAGCQMVITLGNIAHPLKALQDGARCTWFVAESTPPSARQAWIAGALAPLGSFTVDAGAAQALLSGKSLLPAGVITSEGIFGRGDAVWIKSAEGKLLAKGLSAYKSEDAVKIIGKQTADIENILGFRGRQSLVHRDDLVLL